MVAPAAGLSLSRRRARWPTAELQRLALALPVVAFAWAGWSRRWIGDDGFINLRIVAQLRVGHGPVFNAGERVEAGTSALWVAILWLADVASPIRLEWLAVLLGLGFGVAGLALATAGSRRLVSPVRAALPLGAVVFVALPPVWDFATSGLETGLGIGWLGLSWYLLTRRAGAAPATVAHRAWGVPVVLGLGPLVRPDFAVFSAGFVVMLLVGSPRGWRSRAATIALAGVLPLGYEVFRMGYYASLVPNTALAKEAGSARWAEGWHYVVDFARPYGLWAPLLLVGAFAFAPAVVAVVRAGDKRDALLLVLPVLTGLAHAVWVVRVGGDFMHGRMLLPALFSVLLPVMVVDAATVRARLLFMAVLGWAIVCAVALRVPYRGIGPDDPRFDSIAQHGYIADERGYYVAAAGTSNPVTVDDYRRFRPAAGADAVRRLAGDGVHGLVLDPDRGADVVLPLAPHVDAPVVALFRAIGIAGYAVGTDVYVADRFGLADPVVAREDVGRRGRPGHEKVGQLAWYVARFADQDAPLPPHVDARDVAAARRALQCRPLAGLAAATDDPVSVARFARNVGESLSLSRLRYSGSPQAAAAELC